MTSKTRILSADPMGEILRVFRVGVCVLDYPLASVLVCFAQNMPCHN